MFIGRSVLERLAALAPVTAVRDNNDNGSWAADLRESEVLKIGEIFVYAIHDLARIDIDPVTAGIRVVVSGHSHEPAVDEHDGVLFVNLGSAGPRRFKLPISAAEVIISGASASARLVELRGAGAR